jgi:translin
VSSRRDQLASLAETARSQLQAAHEAREEALARCRETIRACGLAIRAVHRLEPAEARRLLADADGALRRAQRVLQPFPSLAAAGFLHDAAKEYAEGHLTVALVASSVRASCAATDGGADEKHVSSDTHVPGPDELGVALPAWLNGLAEAASELRRHLLDRLRAGELGAAEELLDAMEDVYDLLVTIEYPDALTGGLRRTTDALRAVLERSRSDVTTTVLQFGLQRAIEAAQRDR